ncbi:hypothetical protein ACFXPS_27680 [Nocardia sp. NPDC059091]|uniref:hypothetical protein n=1 Tax=Nocardia sp. NPDC059091 TaxID=3346724 RepID=UPI00368FBA60
MSPLTAGNGHAAQRVTVLAPCVVSVHLDARRNPFTGDRSTIPLPPDPSRVNGQPW